MLTFKKIVDILTRFLPTHTSDKLLLIWIDFRQMHSNWQHSIDSIVFMKYIVVDEKFLNFCPEKVGHCYRVIVIVYIYILC